MSHRILIFGGRSDERLVSVASAQNLADQYSFSSLWFLDTQGALFKVSREELRMHQRPVEIEFKPKEKPFANSLAEALPMMRGATFFIGLHGTEGEDGTLQSFFEKNKIFFTGSASEASQRCFVKDLAKLSLQNKEVLLSPQYRLDLKEEGTALESTLEKLWDQMGAMVIKPLANGSSIGLNFIQAKADIKKVVANLRSSKESLYLVEKFIKGRELTVGVIEVIEAHSRSPRTLPPSEVILSKDSKFDYEGKYLGRGTIEVTPAQIPSNVTAMAQNLGLLAHQQLGCYGYSRTDMIWTEEGMYFLETNTLPGMTKASFIPQQLSAAGLNVSDFIEQQILLAEVRFGEKVK